MNSLQKIQSNLLEQSNDKHLSKSYLTSFNTTINNMNNYIVVLKIHGLEAIQVWSSETFQRTASVSSTSARDYRLGTWSSCSSLSNRSATTASAAPSIASTICSEDETDEDYYSGAEGSIKGSTSPSPRLRYILNPSQELDDQTKADSQLELIVLEQPSQDLKACKFRPQTSAGQAFKASDMVILRSKPINAKRNAVYDVTIAFGSISNKIGKAYLTLDPHRSTQGTARAHIFSNESKGPNSGDLPIGQLQFEFLLITNPTGFNTRSPQPVWLSRLAQLDAGHRGSGSGCRVDIPGTILENTVDSFNYAARHGADMCELDVFVSADGIPVVYHDFDVDIGKSKKIQVNEYTLKELREFSRLSFNEDGRNFELDVKQQAETNRPFPTLEEVLKNVDMSCALNIEIKWPQLQENGQLQGLRNREVNDFVDRILDCIMAHHNGRSIILSTFDADIAIMMRLKQTEFPVLFLTTGDSQRFTDPRTKTVKNGIHFAQAFDLAGINPRSDHITQYLVRYAKERNLLVYSWGNEINSAQAIRELKRIGLNGVIYDKIDLIKPKD